MSLHLAAVNPVLEGQGGNAGNPLTGGHGASRVLGPAMGTGVPADLVVYGDDVASRHPQVADVEVLQCLNSHVVPQLMVQEPP